MANDKDSVAVKLFLISCNVVGWFWNTFTFFPWYILSGNFKKPRYGQIQSKSLNGAPAGPYKDIEHLNGVQDGFNGICTVDKLFKYDIVSCVFSGVFLCVFIART